MRLRACGGDRTTAPRRVLHPPALSRATAVFLVVALVMACCACSPVSSGVELRERTLGDLSFMVPKGWERASLGDMDDYGFESICFSDKASDSFVRASSFDDVYDDEGPDGLFDGWVDDDVSEGFLVVEEMGPTEDGELTVYGATLTKGSEVKHEVLLVKDDVGYMVAMVVDDSVCDDPQLLIEEIDRSIKVS